MNSLSCIGMTAAFFILSPAFADLRFAPPSFAFVGSEGEERAVFMDITSARYEITYDAATKSAVVESSLRFETLERGFPLFDLVPNPIAAELDGMPVGVKKISSPDESTTYRQLFRRLEPGKHTLRLRSRIEEFVRFNSEGVSSAFWMSDIDDRSFLERYLPSNLEFDTYAMILHVRVLGYGSLIHEVFTNGSVTTLASNEWVITFPSWYNSASPFFHLTPVGSKDVERFNYVSIDSRKIPVTLYRNRKGVATAKSLRAFRRTTERTLAELERDYGPWPHPSLVICAEGVAGGMEHSGATLTDHWALPHELFHSYHARAVTPASGNDGWMDEAIAAWRDYKYGRPDHLPPDYSSIANLGNRSRYIRYITLDPYTYGSEFLRSLNDLFLSTAKRRSRETGRSVKLGMRDFLRKYFERRKYTLVTSEIFRKDLEEYSGLNLLDYFRTSIYDGENGPTRPKPDQTEPAQADRRSEQVPEHSPYHIRLSEEQLEQIL